MACDPVTFPLKLRQTIAYGPLVINCQDANGDAVPLTGFTVFAVGRPQLESPNNIDLMPVITNAATGEITISLTGDQISAFPLGDYNWDLVLEDAGGVGLGPFLAGPLQVLAINSRDR